MSELGQMLIRTVLLQGWLLLLLGKCNYYYTSYPILVTGRESTSAPVQMFMPVNQRSRNTETKEESSGKSGRAGREGANVGRTQADKRVWEKKITDIKGLRLFWETMGSKVYLRGIQPSS